MANTFSIKVAGQTQEFEDSLTNLNKGMKMLKSEAKTLDKSLKIDPKNAENAEKLYGNLNQQLALTNKTAQRTKEELSNIDPKVDLASFVKLNNRLTNLTSDAGTLKKKLEDTFSEGYNLKVNELSEAEIKAAMPKEMFTIDIGANTVGFEKSLEGLTSGLSTLKDQAKSLNESVKLDPSNITNAKALYDNLNAQLKVTAAAAKEAESELAKIDPKVDGSGFVEASNRLEKLKQDSISLKKTLSDTFTDGFNLRVNAPSEAELKAAADAVNAEIRALIPPRTISITVDGDTSKFKAGLDGALDGLNSLKQESGALQQALSIDPSSTENAKALYDSLNKQLKLTSAAAYEAQKAMDSIDPKVDGTAFIKAHTQLINLQNDSKLISKTLESTFSRGYELRVNAPDANELKKSADDAMKSMPAATYTITVNGNTAQLEDSLDGLKTGISLLESEASSLSESLKFDPSNIVDAEALFKNLNAQLALTDKAAQDARVNLRMIDASVDPSGFVAASKELSSINSKATSLRKQLADTFSEGFNLKVNEPKESEVKEVIEPAIQKVTPIITVKIAGDTKTFTGDIDGLDHAIVALNGEASELSKSLNFDGSAEDASRADALYKNLTKQLSLTAQQAAKVKAELSNIDPQVDASGFNRAQDKLIALEKQSKNLSAQLDSSFDKPYDLKVSDKNIDSSGIASKISSPIKSGVSAAGSFVGSTMKSAAGKLGGYFSSTAGKITGAITAPVKAAASGIKEIMTGALRQVGSSIATGIGNGLHEVVGNMQETQTAANGLKKTMEFKGAGKSYDELSKSLSTTATNTNISTKAADKFASVLIGIGKNAKDTGKIVDAAANANQAFGGSGEAFDSVSTALGQISSSGKVTADNINQITDANAALGAALKSQVYENYKKAGGAQTSFNDAMAKGEISTDDLNKALVQVSDKGGKAIQTLPDAMDSLKEGIGTKMQPIFDSLTASLAGVVNKAAEFVQGFDMSKIQKKFESFDIKGAIEGISGAFSNIIGTVKDFANQFAGAFQQVTGEPLTLSNAFTMVSDLISDRVNTIIGYVQQIIDAFGQAFSTIDVSTLSNGLNMVMAALQSISGFIVDTLSSVIAGLNLQSIVDIITNIASAIYMVVATIQASGIMDVVVAVFDGIINAVSSVISHITGAVNKILKAFAPLAAGLKPIFTAIKKVINDWSAAFKKVWDPIIDLIGDLVAAFMKELQPSIKKFAKVISPVIEALGPVFQKVGDIAKWLVTKVLKPVLIPVFHTIGKVIGGVIDVISTLVGWLKKVAKFGTGVFNKVKSFFGFGGKNGGNIDAQIKNYKSAINNSTHISNATQTINVTPSSSLDTMQVARQVAKLIKSGAV